MDVGFFYIVLEAGVYIIRYVRICTAQDVGIGRKNYYRTRLGTMAREHLRSAQFFAACTAVARLPRAGEQHKPNANAGFQSLDIFYKFLIGGKTSLGSRTLLSVDTVTVEFEETLLRRFAVNQPDMTD
jgi:hypothetical protein